MSLKVRASREQSEMPKKTALGQTFPVGRSEKVDFAKFGHFYGNKSKFLPEIFFKLVSLESTHRARSFEVSLKKSSD